MCPLQMQTGGLDVSLFKPTVLILFSDIEISVKLLMCLTSIKQAVPRISARHWNAVAGGLETCLRRFYPVMENIFVLLL